MTSFPGRPANDGCHLRPLAPVQLFSFQRQLLLDAFHFAQA
jgi:hypothetical protein